MVGIFRIRVILIGDYSNTTSTVSSDLETKTFTLTPRNRTYTTTIRATIDSEAISVATYGEVPSCSFAFFVDVDTSFLDIRRPEIVRQNITCANSRLRHITFIQRIS